MKLYDCSSLPERIGVGGDRCALSLSLSLKSQESTDLIFKLSLSILQRVVGPWSDFWLDHAAPTQFHFEIFTSLFYSSHCGTWLFLDLRELRSRRYVEVSRHCMQSGSKVNFSWDPRTGYLVILSLRWLFHFPTGLIYRLSDHLMFLFCSSTAGFVYMMCVLD